MYVERNAEGQIAAAFLEEQFRGQEWLPIDSRALQKFLAVVPQLTRRRGCPFGGGSTTVADRR